MHIVVGLGNPGEEYHQTRHNFGFEVVDFLCARFSGRWKAGKTKSEEALVEIEGDKVLLVKPLTFMNVSGHAVLGSLQYYKEDVSSLLVIHDELDLPLGKMKFASSGSAGGHNGVSSIIDILGTRDFNRLRLGIGRPLDKEKVVSYVLSRFSKAEKDIVLKQVEQAAEAVVFALKQGVPAAMNRFHQTGSP